MAEMYAKADLEHASSSNSSSSDAEVRPSWSGRRVAKVAIATGCLVACIAGASVWGHSRGKTSVRMLIESSDMADVASNNLLKMGIAHHGDEVPLHEIATSQLRKLTDDLNTNDEAAYRLLDSLMITKEQKDHILKKVSSLSDPRVQKLGEEVVQVALENKDKKPDVFLAALKDKFSGRLPELKKLQKELLPQAEDMMKNMKETHLLKEMAKQEIAITKQQKERRLTEWTTATPSVHVEQETGEESGMTHTEVVLMDIAEVATGLLEQARVALQQVDFIGESFGADLHISPLTKSAVGATDFVAELMECVLRAGSNMVKASMCPMKYASAGADALECIDNLLNMDNGKFAMNGQQPPATVPAAGVPVVPVVPVAENAGGWAR